MFEFKIKPKRVKFERRTAKGKWIPAFETVFENPPNLPELFMHMDLADQYEFGARALSSRGKQIATTRARGFYFDLSASNLVSVIYDTPDNLTRTPVLYSHNNHKFKPIKEFQDYILEHNGIDKAKELPPCESDGYLCCYKVRLMDGKVITVAFYN